MIICVDSKKKNTLFLGKCRKFYFIVCYEWSIVTIIRVVEILLPNDNIPMIKTISQVKFTSVPEKMLTQKICYQTKGVFTSTESYCRLNHLVGETDCVFFRYLKKICSDKKKKTLNKNRIKRRTWIHSNIDTHTHTPICNEKISNSSKEISPNYLKSIHASRTKDNTKSPICCLLFLPRTNIWIRDWLHLRIDEI